MLVGRAPDGVREAGILLVQRLAKALVDRNESALLNLGVAKPVPDLGLDKLGGSRTRTGNEKKKVRVGKVSV